MRNKFLNIVLSAMLALFAWSCSEESNMDPEGQWTFSQPAISSPADGSSVVLNEATPNAKLDFSWSAASSSAGYSVTYSIVIDSVDSENFDTPILEVKSDNVGKSLTASIAYNLLDEALSLAGYPANAIANLKWAVKASCMSRTSFTTANISVKRFATEYLPTQLFITGEASENGTDLSKALPFRRLNNATGDISNKYEIYTALVADKTYYLSSSKTLPSYKYGGANGILVKSGSPILASESGVFRITVDMDAMTYSLVKIDKWSIVGSIVTGGWGGDEALEYKGAGVWQRIVELTGKGGFAFRANGDWAWLLKHIKSTSNLLVLQADAVSQGIAVPDSIEDINSQTIGSKIVTLDLSGVQLTYKIEKDPNAPSAIATPSTLFLLANGAVVQEFTKDADTFTSPVYLALQSSVTYTLNSAADGSGTSYAIDANIGATATLGGDKVSGLAKVSEEASPIAVQYDQAFLLSIDFAATKLSWSYFNLKVFHWSIWDTRNEYPMTYVHPFKFTATGVALEAGYEMKFNSPWAVQFGVVAGNGDDATAMSGSTTNADPSGNFKCIQSSGTYDAVLTIENTYLKGTYSITAH